MRKFSRFAGLFAAVALCAGCATEIPNEEPTADDFLTAADELCSQLKRSPQFQEYLEWYAKEAVKQFTAANPGQEQPRGLTKPLLAISEINFAATGVRMQPEFLTARLRDSLFEGNRVRVTTAIAGNGGYVDPLTHALRDMPNANFKFDAAMQRGTLNVPVLSLGGSISRIRSRETKRLENAYLFNLSMTNLVTGEAEWSKSMEVRRVFKGSTVGY